MRNEPFVLRDVRVPAVLIDEPGSFAGPANGGCVSGDLLFEARCPARFVSLIGDETNLPVFEADGGILLPCFVEPHCHLDKCHTIERMAFAGGDLTGAIEAQTRDKRLWTAEDIRRRGLKGLEELSQTGCALLRTHIDWAGYEKPLAWSVFGELADACSEFVTLQRSALLSLDLFCEDDLAFSLAAALSADEAVLGVFVLGQAQMTEKLTRVFDAAERYGLALDFHVDESLDPAHRGLEAIADTAAYTGHQGPVLCGHACSLSVLSDAEADRVIEKLAEQSISVVALPSTNLYLQGRGRRGAASRGITRVRDLVDGGVNVCFGCDNVADAFCPVGRLDPRHTLELAILAAQLEPPSSKWLPGITTGAARALGVGPKRFREANISQLQLSDAGEIAEVIRGGPCRRLTDVLRPPTGAN